MEVTIAVMALSRSTSYWADTVLSISETQYFILGKESALLDLYKVLCST